MTIKFTPASFGPTDLEELLLAPPSATPLSGDITVRRTLTYANDSKSIMAGVWESEPGVSRWEFADRGEFIVVLSGRMTVQEDGKEEIEVKAGDAVVFPIGWAGIWTVHETLRKVLVFFTAEA